MFDKVRFPGCVFAVLLVVPAALAQGGESAPVAAKPAKIRVPNFIDPTLFDLTVLLPPPPAQTSSTTRAELTELHRIEHARTPAQVAAAQYDDTHEDLFLYASVLGSSFSAESLPRTAAFSADVRNDVGVVDAPLKKYFGRPRPYNYDATLHPVCATNKEGSYPSGHSFNGFVFAYILTQIVPEKHAEILARADDYAHNRMICEAHYASDIEASRRGATFLVGALMTNPRFQREFAEAREEIRSRLALPRLP